MNFGHGYGKRPKYGNKKTRVNGEVLDSKREAKRYQELLLLQRAGESASLERQVKYEIIPEHREPDTIGPRGGRKKGKIIEPARYYIADFVYYDSQTAELVVEDVKGYREGQAYALFKIKSADVGQIRDHRQGGLTWLNTSARNVKKNARRKNQAMQKDSAATNAQTYTDGRTPRRKKPL